MSDLEPVSTVYRALLEQVDRLRSQIGYLRCELDESDRLCTLGLTTAMVAHEFNNLLTPIAAWAERALLFPDDQSRTRAALQLAVDNTHQASAIATALLALTGDRPGGGGDPGTTCLLAPVVQSALACLGRDLRADGIRVEVDIGQNAEAGISAAALQQVIVNLVLNARHAMLPSGGTLTIRSRVQTGSTGSSPRCSTGNTPAAGTVVLEVSDSGCGIEAGDLERIFQPFVRRSHGVGEPEGTGLGLAICKRLIEAVGGAIEVNSRIGTGTRFLVVLPGAGSVTHKRSA